MPPRKPATPTDALDAPIEEIPVTTDTPDIVEGVPSTDEVPEVTPEPVKLPGVYLTDASLVIATDAGEISLEGKFSSKTVGDVDTIIESHGFSRSSPWFIQDDHRYARVAHSARK